MVSVATIALISSFVISSFGTCVIDAFTLQPSQVTSVWSRNSKASDFSTFAVANVDKHDDDDDEDDQNVDQCLTHQTGLAHLTRRKFWQSSSLVTVAAGTSSGWMGISPAHAKDETRALVLPSRLESNNLVPPMYGMDGVDVFYPSWLTGTWKVVSVTTDVQAPCGVALFGGNETYRLARQDIGPEHALVYESRFLPTDSSSSTSSCIADREFNVKSIAQVALGPNSIVDVALATPNHFTCLVLPQQKSTTAAASNTNSSTLLNVDILVLQRRQEPLDDLHFACSEVVREIVSSADQADATTSTRSSSQTAIFKEVETISLYTGVTDDNGVVSTVTCQQRSASFLVPRREDPMSIALWQATQGLPTDVRCYKVTYTRRS